MPPEPPVAVDATSLHPRQAVQVKDIPLLAARSLDNAVASEKGQN
jgi:hypothetical protein